MEIGPYFFGTNAIFMIFRALLGFMEILCLFIAGLLPTQSKVCSHKHCIANSVKKFEQKNPSKAHSFFCPWQYLQFFRILAENTVG